MHRGKNNRLHCIPPLKTRYQIDKKRKKKKEASAAVRGIVNDEQPTKKLLRTSDSFLLGSGVNK